MRKDYIRKRLEQAKKQRRTVLFYRRCGNCGQWACFEADYILRQFYYRHNSANCYYNEEYDSEAEFLEALMANSEAIVKSELE
jgi:hypothetical protein